MFQLKFFIDEQQAATATTRSELSFMKRGSDVYLGGNPNPEVNTGRLVSVNLDGALVDVSQCLVFTLKRLRGGYTAWSKFCII